VDAGSALRRLEHLETKLDRERPADLECYRQPQLDFIEALRKGIE
jgi:hypothetical protein